MKIDPHFFPLTSYPFDTYCMVLDEYKPVCKVFEPTTLEKDLEKGTVNVLLYWYPEYVDKLFEMAMIGRDYREYLDVYNPHNSHFFTTMFPSIIKQLDKIISDGIKNNHLSEMKVKPTKN